MRKNLIMCSFLICITACASRPDKIDAAYVSPLEYRDYSCNQVSQEISRVGRKLSEVSGIQDDTASNDSVAMGVGLVLFWPALFFIDTDDKKEEVARLKGEFEALEQVAIQKNCTIAEEIEKAREYEMERLRKKKAEEERAEDYWDDK